MITPTKPATHTCTNARTHDTNYYLISFCSRRHSVLTQPININPSLHALTKMCKSPQLRSLLHVHTPDTLHVIHYSAQKQVPCTYSIEVKSIHKADKDMKSWWGSVHQIIYLFIIDLQKRWLAQKFHQVSMLKYTHMRTLETDRNCLFRTQLDVIQTHWLDVLLMQHTYSQSANKIL